MGNFFDILKTILLIIFQIVIALIPFLIIYSILSLLSIWLCDIDVDKTYKWYSGIWHALWFIPNLIKCIFTDGLWKAEIFTTGYNIWWWITNIIALASFFFETRNKVLAIIVIIFLFHFL